MRYYLFCSDKPLPRKVLENSFKALKFDTSSLSFQNDDFGCLTGSEDLLPILNSFLPSLQEDSGVNLVFLSTHALDELSLKLLKSAASFFLGEAVYPTDILFKEFSFGDYSSLPYLHNIFRGVEPELMETSSAYLKSDLNASLASSSLYIHRNTFNYRLQKFIDVTGLDIRNYHNALLLEIYLGFRKR